MQITKDQIVNHIAEHLGIDPEVVKPMANFAMDLGADSLDLVEFVMELEEALEIEISDDEAAKILTVQDVFDFVANHWKEQIR